MVVGRARWHLTDAHVKPMLSTVKVISHGSGPSLCVEVEDALSCSAESPSSDDTCVESAHAAPTMPPIWSPYPVLYYNVWTGMYYVNFWLCWFAPLNFVSAPLDL